MNRLVVELRLLPTAATRLKLAATPALVELAYRQKRWLRAIACTMAMHYDCNSFINSIILGLASLASLFLQVLLPLRRHLLFCCAFL